MGEKFGGFESKFEESAEKENIELILKLKSERVDLRDFSDIYGKEEIEKDMDYVKLCEKRIEDEKKLMTEEEREIVENNKKRAEAFEILFSEQSHEGEWLGYETMVSIASRYDDFNGTDFWIEIEDSENRSSFLLSGDASTASDYSIIKGKIEKNFKKISKEEKSSRIKYFESQIFDEDNSRYKGELKDLIPLVVGVDRESGKELFDLFAELKNLEKNNGPIERRKELRNILARNPIQVTLLNEIKTQLEMYVELLPEKNDKKKECEDVLKKVEEIIERKREEGSVDFEEGYSHDKVFENIEEVCSNILYLKRKEAI